MSINLESCPWCVIQRNGKVKESKLHSNVNDKITFKEIQIVYMW